MAPGSQTPVGMVFVNQSLINIEHNTELCLLLRWLTAHFCGRFANAAWSLFDFLTDTRFLCW
jgi:hypothetical protein